MSSLKYFALFVMAVLSHSSIADAQNRSSPDLSLSSYTCKEYISDASHPNTAEKLLRAMMMVSWATGFATAHSQSDIRADKGALEIIGSVLADVCRQNPSELATSVFVDEINRNVSK